MNARPHPHHALKQALGKTFLRINGWRTEGHVPDERVYVLLAYPHTSNWDFMYLLTISWVMGFDVSWIGKDSLFKFPFGGLMRALGGIPVVRGQQKGQVDQVAEQLRSAQADPNGHLVVCIAPEGTRKLTQGWKTGFYHMALQAGVPLQLGFLDYTRKVGGFGPLVWPSGDLERDLEQCRAFYAGIDGRFPKQAGPIAIAPKRHPPGEKAA